jgi:hypothetical protein
MTIDINLRDPFMYHADERQLQAFLMACTAVAGKNAKVQQGKLNALLGDPVFDDVSTGRGRPLESCYVMGPDVLRQLLERHKMGQYDRLARLWFALGDSLAGRSLSDGFMVNREALCSFPGIGMKTASFFVLYTQRQARVACVDTHILRWLRGQGVRKVPKSTPGSVKEYLRLETVVLAEAERRRLDPAVFDYTVWINSQLKP